MMIRVCKMIHLFIPKTMHGTPRSELRKHRDFRWQFFYFQNWEGIVRCVKGAVWHGGEHTPQSKRIDLHKYVTAGKWKWEWIKHSYFDIFSCFSWGKRFLTWHILFDRVIQCTNHFGEGMSPRLTQVIPQFFCEWWESHWVFPKIGMVSPKWMVYNGNPHKNRWFGGPPIFGNTQLVNLLRWRSCPNCLTALRFRHPKSVAGSTDFGTSRLWCSGCERYPPWYIILSLFTVLDTVDGRNPASVHMWIIPGGAGFLQQYLPSCFREQIRSTKFWNLIFFGDFDLPNLCWATPAMNGKLKKDV